MRQYRVFVINVPQGIGEAALEKQLEDSLRDCQERLGEKWELITLANTAARLTFTMTFGSVR